MTDANTTTRPPANNLVASQKLIPTREPTLLEEMARRANTRSAGPEVSAIEQAGRDHLQLQEDNAVLIDQLKQAQIDLAALTRGYDDIRAERDDLRGKLQTAWRTIGAITEGLGTAGEQILRVLKTGKSAMDALPEEIERYRPNPTGEKIATGANADD